MPRPPHARRVDASRPRVVPGYRRPRRRALVDGARRPRRRRALPRGVPLRLRRAEGLDARSRCCSPRTSATRSRCPGMNPADDAVRSSQQTLNELERFQCEQRRLRLLAGRLRVTVSPYLTAYMLHVYQGGDRPRLPRQTRRDRSRAYDYLSAELAATPPANEEWWPSYTAWQAFAVKVLAEGGRNQDSQPHPALRLSRPDAGVRAGLPARRARRAEGETTGDRVERPAPADDQRHPARGRQRARRGAGRPVPAVVLELERPLDGHRAQLAREAERATEADATCGGSCAG